AGIVSLAVVVKEKESAVLYDGSADISAKLVEVVAGLNRQGRAGVHCIGALQLIDRIVGVEPAITEELECISVKGVRPRFGDNINHSAAGASKFGGVAVGVDL